MARSALLILAALLGSCAQFTDAGDEPSTVKSEKAELYTSILCSPIPGTSSFPSSVHSLHPADISAVHFLGSPHSHRHEASRVVSRVAELLSMFNPEVIVQHVDETSVEARSLLEEAEELSLSVSHQETDWKFVLLFIPADSICACSPDGAENANAIMQDVEAALTVLQEKLHHALVHVAVWSSNNEQDSTCECARGGGFKKRLQQAILLRTLQDSLGLVLEHSKWHSDREDFTVVLQSAPVILEQTSDTEDTSSDLNQLALQLWTNLLQPSTAQPEVTKSGVMSIPCPTQERPFLRTQKNSPEKEERLSARLNPVMGTEMLCMERSPSPTVPTSVHEIRPADINVVAAVGDSLTAANGVGAKTNNILLVLNEYRGLSWSIGGDENITTVTTLPNILREFNSNVTGFSLGISGEDSPKAFLNQAVPGATSVDMVQQVEILVNKMKTDPRIDFINDWKVITMFIGGNDICDYCSDSVYSSPRNVAIRISQALDILHREVPRAFVNLVEMLNIVPLRAMHQDPSLGCPTWFVNLVCRCVVKPVEGSIELQQVEEYNRGYQRAMRELIDSGRYDTRSDFTVVLQPFLRELYLPRLEDGRPDRSFMSPDCFHLSQKAHTLMARALWNNMLEPVGNKTFSQDFQAGVDLTCPSETKPFLGTAINSNYTFPGPPTTAPPVDNWGSDFSCLHTAPSNSVPTSVHKLRPGDIQVVAAVGDSLSTGFGARANNIGQMNIEYKGVAWSIGGDDTLETVTTIPNILKKFNPNIKGMSLGEGTQQSGFNVAVSGAKISGIPGQVRRLIDLMKNDSTVDFENDWKLLTLFIGGNDLCQYCDDRATLSPKNYSFHMKTSLDMLYKEVPRMIVNVQEILEIEGLRGISRDSLVCTVLQRFGCACVRSPKENSPELDELKLINRELQFETEKLVYSGIYDGREDFAVVIQPFFKNTIVPLNLDGMPDDTYFGVDCFHFSERGHSDMAVNLWNNMLQPEGEKQMYNIFTNERNRLICPSEEHPYIFTRVNSLPTTAPPTISPSVTPTISPSVPPTISPSVPPIKLDSSGKVPAWLAAVLAVAGLGAGCAVTCLFFLCKAKRSKEHMASKVEMKTTGL